MRASSEQRLAGWGASFDAGVAAQKEVNGLRRQVEDLRESRVQALNEQARYFQDRVGELEREAGFHKRENEQSLSSLSAAQEEIIRLQRALAGASAQSEKALVRLKQEVVYLRESALQADARTRLAVSPGGGGMTTADPPAPNTHPNTHRSPKPTSLALRSPPPCEQSYPRKCRKCCSRPSSPR